MLSAFVTFRWEYFGLSILLIPLSIFIRSIRWKRILKNFGIESSQWEAFKMCILGGVSTALVPSFGSLIKVPYVRKNDIGLAQPVVSLFGEKYLDFALPLIFGIISYILICLNTINWLTLLIIFLLGFVFYKILRLLIKIFYLIIIHRLYNKFFNRHLKIEKHLLDFERVLDFYTYFLSVLELSIGGFVRIYLLVKALGIHFNIVNIVLVTSINSFITFIPISYLGVGTRDVGLMAAFRFFHYSSEEAIALSMTILLSRIIFVFVGSIFWLIDPPPLENLTKKSS
jgi:uncharacterized membrane protein YbhN (UPF0104 family)